MAQDIDWKRLASATPHRPSLPERLGDGPVFLLALIFAGAGLFFVGVVVYALLRNRYWPTAIQKAELAWLSATQAATVANEPPHWHPQALADLTTEDRQAVEKVLRTTPAASCPRVLQFFYKTRESLGWLWMFALMMAPVCWAGYALVWKGQTGTTLWWAYLVLFSGFSVVVGVLPISMAWQELAARRSGAPKWQVDDTGIRIGSHMNIWPQIEEIRLREVVRRKQAPLVLVELKRHSDTEHFPNIDPANIRLCAQSSLPDAADNSSGPAVEIVLPENATERAATLAAILRYRQHGARLAFAAQ